MVVLTAYLIHRGSHESKDTDDKVNEALSRIERRLERIEHGVDGGSPLPVPEFPETGMNPFRRSRI